MACHICQTQPCSCDFELQCEAELDLCERDINQCISPGTDPKVSVLGGYDDNNCPKAVAPFRGFDSQGNLITTTNSPFKGAFAVQDTSGKVGWTDKPKVDLPDQSIGAKVVTEADDAGRSIPKLLGVSTDGDMVEVIARGDQLASTLKYYPGSGFTLLEDTSGDDQYICTTLNAAFTVDPTNTTGYIVNVGDTSFLVAGLSVMIATKEYVVTQVLSPNLVRIKSNYVPTAPATIPLGTPMCSIGFRPISGTSSAFVDTLSGSLSGQEATLTLPADVASRKVPGLFWRDQLGQVSFLPAPVNSTTGVITPNLILRTPLSPTAGAANKPEFIAAPGGYSWITPATAFTASATSGGPTAGTFTFDVATVTGYIPGAQAVILDVKLSGSTNNSYYRANYTINGLVAGSLAVTSSFATDTDTNQLIVPITPTTVLTLVISKIGDAGNNAYNMQIRVIGFIG